METTPARTVRERVRAEMTDEIKAVAQRHLAEQGSAALSLRAVAREVGLVSSAVYRYFRSRDELLTALIIDAYDAVGDLAEATEPRRRPAQGTSAAKVVERWLALAGALRRWALDNLQEYCLIYGSPVPGYEAPLDTVAPATRINLVFLRLVADGVASGAIATGPAGRLPRAVRSDLEQLRDVVRLDIPEPVMLRALAVWAELFGLLTLELFGHLHNVIHDHDAFFELQMTRAARYLIGSDAAGGPV